eukprot:NODE_2364_length_2228_cov_9.631604.p1 GENE.NODE_2364_length_2228_cov_9.631604~~NODE_2364_length_2228_cov_9.631604.p1  ORF type:complete len:683 (+),score=198.55 NODE_2364_length_2228_cov_9.631604:119-2050(+)
MAVVLDELVRPLNVIDALLQDHLVRNGSASPLEWGEQAHFVRALGLEDEERFAAIPCINDVEVAERVPPFSLVRYHGIVQDVFDPEIFAMFLEEHPVDGSTDAAGVRIVTSKYRESLCAPPGRQYKDIGTAGFGQCGACYCVPLPGETAWAQQVAAARTRAAGGLDVLAQVAAAGAAAPASAGEATAATKRRRDDDVDMGAAGDEVDASPSVPRVTGRRVAEPTAGADVGPIELRSAEEFGLNFPLPGEERRGSGAAMPCILKLYDGLADVLRVCESFEALGVLVVDPEVAQLSSQPLDGFGQDARQPSTALVPRLHVLLLRQMPFYHPMLPYSAAWLTERRLGAAYEQHFGMPAALAVARAAALAPLLRCVGMDALAAEYLLLLLTSRTFDKLGEMCLGKFSLCLSGFPAGSDVRGLCAFAAELMPRTAFLEVSRESLNTMKWLPKKDFTANRLVASQLQLAAGTLLVIDETKMSTGGLSPEGTKALQAVQSLVCDHKLMCDFMEYNVNLPLEVTSLIVSAGKSLIGTHVTVPVQPQVQVAAATTSGDEALQAARLLIELGARSGRMKMSDEVGQRFSSDFSSFRQTHEVSQDLCHTWMSLARAYCLTHGSDELTHDRWQAVLELERQRFARLPPSAALPGM